mmetsp:Transcript_18780/g.18752  ORF Transcript_18780/g.18752 Transcript_18780/m.18752 type:complete len:110 (+) Transcript_18780:984-1313(+)
MDEEWDEDKEEEEEEVEGELKDKLRTWIAKQRGEVLDDWKLILAANSVLSIELEIGFIIAETTEGAKKIKKGRSNPKANPKSNPKTKPKIRPKTNQKPTQKPTTKPTQS